MIRQEILRRQTVLREQMAIFNTEPIAKYEIRLLDAEYWNVVLKVMQDHLLPLEQIHRGEKKALENHSAKLGQTGSTAGFKSSGSSAVSVQESHDGINHVTGVVNIGSLSGLDHSPELAPTVSALGFVSAREAVGGKVLGVR